MPQNKKTMTTDEKIPYSDCPNSEYQINKTRTELRKIKRDCLNRLKEQYRQSKLLVVQGNFYLSGYDKAKTYYNAMRLFCLDTQLLDFNTIEVMENEVNSSF